MLKDSYSLVRNQTILLLFSASIFLSFTTISFIEFRFLYLFTIFFLIYDYFFKKKLSISSLVITILITVFLFSYSYFFYFINFNDLQFLDFINDQYTVDPKTQSNRRGSFTIKTNIIKLAIESFIVGLSIIIIFFYKNLLVTNLIKIIDYFVISFICILFIYNYNNSGITFDLLFKCDLGFFYYTRYLFSETSHFSIVATPVILSFVFNIKYYLKKKIIFLFYILFLIFTYGNFTLTFYLSIMSGIFIIFITNNNIEKPSKYIFCILLIISNIFFFKENIFSGYSKNIEILHQYKKISMKNCISRAILHDEENYVKPLRGGRSDGFYQGSIINGSRKINETFSKNISNISVGVFIYSYYVAKESILQNPLGVGFKNYINFRNIIDQSLDIDWEKTNIEVELNHVPAGKIKFKEKYMPTIPGVILTFNQHSGGTNFSKLIVEFGLFALLALLLICISCFSNRFNQQVKVTLIPLIFIQIFIRGTGYYNSGFLICLIIILLLILSPISKKINHENNDLK